MKKLLLTVFLLSISTSYACAAPQGPPANDELGKALQECMAASAKDSNGHPDRAAVDQCMTNKGFRKPAGRPGSEPPQQ